MTLGCHNQYYDELLRIKLLPKRDICLDKVSEKLLTFHDRLTAIGWRCFTLDPYWVKEQWV